MSNLVILNQWVIRNLTLTDMNKNIEFSLNKFSAVPNLLREVPSVNLASSNFEIDLSRLFHHYYTDSYGIAPPDPNHGNFEYLNFLAPCTDFRFLGNGPGSSSGKKRNISYDLGQAFCRYFLYEFCNVTYFAHIDKVLNAKTHPAFNGLKIERAANGFIPDYLCAEKVHQPFIAEAKGRYSSISFTNSEFQDWREQFSRIVVKDKYGIEKKLKGYIVGTRFATETSTRSIKSKVFAEDPETPGNEFLNDNSLGIGRGCIAIHYSRLMSKLGLNLISEALGAGFVVPNDLTFNLPVWRCNYAPLNGALFFGGYFSDSDPQMAKREDGSIFFYPNILKLGVPSPTFFGIYVPVMRQLRQACLGNWQVLSEMPELPDSQFRASNLAWLRDGSISGSLEFFDFIGTQQL